MQRVFSGVGVRKVCFRKHDKNNSMHVNVVILINEIDTHSESQQRKYLLRALGDICTRQQASASLIEPTIARH